MRVEEIPADMMDKAQEYRTKLLDAVSDVDEEIMMLVLDEQPVPEDMIRKALRKGTIDNLVVPASSSLVRYSWALSIMSAGISSTRMSLPRAS